MFPRSIELGNIRSQPCLPSAAGGIYRYELHPDIPIVPRLTGKNGFRGVLLKPTWIVGQYESRGQHRNCKGRKRNTAHNIPSTLFRNIPTIALAATNAVTAGIAWAAIDLLLVAAAVIARVAPLSRTPDIGISTPEAVTCCQSVVGRCGNAWPTEHKSVGLRIAVGCMQG